MNAIVKFVFLLIILTHTSVFSQQIVSASLKGSRTKQQIATTFNNSFIRNGVKYYKVTYTSVDAKGMPDTLSGLMVIPDDLKFEYPKLVYQHGTSDCKKCVPSSYGTSGGEEGQLGLLFGGLGFVSILPDYVGMGEGRGFQTYVHDATTVSATEDMVTACQAWADQNGVFTNKQLFITGYSQGGYASMSFHRHMQTTKGPASVTAAAHLSGPYSLSGVMRDLILGDKAYNYPAYVPNTILGFNEVYNIYNDLNDFFKPEYVPDIQKYYDGSLTVTNLNAKLIQLLNANTGASVGGRLIKDDLMAEIRTNPNHIVNRILKENDVYDWKPESPTRIFYCKADDQVPYLNSIVARDTMTANGTTMLQVMDVNSTADHGGCVTPALTSTLFFFVSQQRITSTAEDIANITDIKIYPNPTSQSVHIIHEDIDVTSLSLIDMTGKIIISQRSDAVNLTTLDINQINSGVYVIKVLDKNGKIFQQRLLVQKN